MSSLAGRIARDKQRRISKLGNVWLYAHPGPVADKVRGILHWQYPEAFPWSQSDLLAPPPDVSEGIVYEALMACGVDAETARRWSTPPRCQRGPFTGRPANSTGWHRGAYDRTTDRAPSLGIYAHPWTGDGCGRTPKRIGGAT